MRPDFIIVATVSPFAFSAAAWGARSKEFELSYIFQAKEDTVAVAKDSVEKINSMSQQERTLLLNGGATFDNGIVQSSLKYGVEALGTYIFLSSILRVVNDKSVLAPVYIGLMLTAMIIWGGKTSGGHFNPAVSVMFWLNGTISLAVMAGYIISQVVGAALAWVSTT